MSDYTVTVTENLKVSISNSPIWDLTDRLNSWRHQILDIGGCWHGEGVLLEPKDRQAGGRGMSQKEMENFFLSNLGRRIIVSSGGIKHYEGLIVRMEYRKSGQVFKQSLEEIANRVKIIYTKIGAQLLTNGDVETAAWTTVGSPSTIETSTAWFAKGTTSMHIVSAALGDGAEVEDSGSPAVVTVTANKAYTCSMIVNVVSGTWSLQVQNAADDSILAQTDTDGAAGRTWLQCQIPDTNTVTSIHVRILSSAGSEEIYADGAVLRASPVRSETGWYEDTDSITERGRIEGIFLEGEMTDDEADDIARRERSERAWPRTEPPTRGSLLPTRRASNQLVIGTMGLAFTLGWRHTLVDGTNQGSNHITALLDESEFIAASDGFIDTNTTEVLVESSNPVTIWRAVEKVIRAGSGGLQWTGGVYPNRQFRYGARPTALQYEFSGGAMRYYGGGGEIDPLDFRPGWCLMADMPAAPLPAGASIIDDPRRVWLNGTWFIASGAETNADWTRETFKL